jgi:hypothetical protein
MTVKPVTHNGAYNSDETLETEKLQITGPQLLQHDKKELRYTLSSDFLPRLKNEYFTAISISSAEATFRLTC